MDQALLAKYDQRVPRYTSYPTAPHFGPAVGAADYRRWLKALDPAVPLSLYVHVPFCDTLCWFCGCHTKIVQRYEPVAAYLQVLRREIALIADLLGARRRVCHVHFGGGSPTILRPDDFTDLFALLRGRFEFTPDADIAVEIDPRGLEDDAVHAMVAAGVNRASIGVQDLDPGVQCAVNRVQSLALTKRVADLLRQVGIGSINVDLMYGLPRQSVAGVLATVDATVESLAPERVCLFGYAHVPWMKTHQRMIDERALPGAEERFAQAMAVANRLQDLGYDWIGLDHFARPDDALARAARAGRLHRNFQGYTTDDAPVRLGFGPSAIGALPEGYVQNMVPMHAYRGAVEAGEPPIARGLALSADDRLRCAVIERLMCEQKVDLDDFGPGGAALTPALAKLADMETDGLVRVAGHKIEVTATGRPFVRTVCAVFDEYLDPGETRHARAV